MSSFVFRDVSYNNFIYNHARNASFPDRHWQDQLVGCFLTNMNKNSFHLRNALKYRWKLLGEISVSKLGRGFYLIKFESSLEILYVLKQGTRVIYGDTFLFQPCAFFVLPQNFEITSEIFEINIHKLYPGQTKIINIMENTQVFGEVIAFDDPIHHFSGYSSMKIRLGINITQSLPVGTYAPNERRSVNWIEFIYQELPRFFCSYCHRIVHEHQDCIDVLLLNNQHMLPKAPSPALPEPVLHALGHFIETDYDDDYYEEMIHNVDFEDPDPEWSDWGSNPFGSPTSSGQNKSTISFFDGEGYQQEGFHSDSSLDSTRTISEA